VNIFRFNRKGDADQFTIKDNIRKVESFQKGDIRTIESEVEQLDGGSSAGNSATSTRAWYQKKFRNCVVLGDSLTEGIEVYGWLSKQQVFGSVGGSVLTDGKLFKKAAATYPKAAFFAFGMNDMGNYRGRPDAFISDYSSLLASFHKKSKDTKICVCSISMPTKKAIKRKKMLGHYKEFNKAIQAMCKKEGYTYIDTTDLLPNHPDLYARDGVHAASAYYPMWMDRMIEAAGL